MKRKIIIILLPILLITGCDKKTSDCGNAELTLFSVTSTETVDSENSSNPKKTFNLFDENMIASFDGYKPCEYKDDVCVIKAKIPESWDYKLYMGGEATLEHNASPDCGLHLYKNGTGFENRIINITRWKFSCSSEKEYDNKQTFNIVTGLQGTLQSSFYIDNRIQACIHFQGFSNISIYIDDIDKEYFEEIKQEIFNVLNSIEIIEK